MHDIPKGGNTGRPLSRAAFLEARRQAAHYHNVKRREINRAGQGYGVFGQADEFPAMILDFGNDVYKKGEFRAPQDQLITFDRNSVRRNWSNTLNRYIEIPVDVLAPDYEPLTGAALGAPIEEASSTKVIRSCAFGPNDTSWDGASDFIVTPALSIFKGQTAHKHENKGLAVFRARRQTVGVLTNAPETLTMIVEGVDATTSSFSIYDATSVGHCLLVSFDWATGVITTDAFTFGTAPSREAIKLSDAGPNGGEVYLIRLTVTPNNAGNTRWILGYLSGTTTNTDTAIIHFAQHEEKAFATSPMVSDVTFTSRAGTGWAFDANGVLQEYGTDVERPQYLYNSTTGVWEGGNVLNEAASTNKCTNFNANPTDLTNVTKGGDAAATLTVVDDSAALAAAGLDQVCSSGKVYKLDNSAGSSDATAQPAGQTGNTNQHTVSAFWRGSGTGIIRLAGTVLASKPIPSAYERTVAENVTPVDAFRNAFVVASPGAVIYFILNQLEESDTVSTPIVVAGSSVTRPADVTASVVASRAADIAEITDLSLINWNASEGTFYIEASKPSDNVFGSDTLLYVNDGTDNNRIWVRYSGTAIDAVITAGGVTQVDFPGFTVGDHTATIRIGVSFKNNEAKLSINGTVPQEDLSLTLPTVTQMLLGSRLSNLEFLNGYIKEIRYYPTIKDVQALTS